MTWLSRGTATTTCATGARPRPSASQAPALASLELWESDITQQGYAKKRAELLAGSIPLIQGVDPSLQADPYRIPPASQTRAPAPKLKDEGFWSDVHPEATHTALVNRVSSWCLGKVLLLHSSKETGAPPDASSTLDNESSIRDPEQLTSAGLQCRQAGHSGLVCLILGVPPAQLTGGRRTALPGSQGKCAPAPPVRRAHGPVGHSHRVHPQLPDKRSSGAPEEVSWTS